MPAPTLLAARGSGSEIETQCPTPGCPNAMDEDGNPRTIAVDPVWEDTDGEHVADSITCGVCGATLWTPNG